MDQQRYLLAEVTGKEVQPPTRAQDPGQGIPDQLFHADAHAVPPTGPLPPGMHQGLPQQPQAMSQQTPTGPSHTAVPSRKRPKSLSPAPVAAQVPLPQPHSCLSLFIDTAISSKLPWVFRSCLHIVWQGLDLDCHYSPLFFVDANLWQKPGKSRG